MQFDNILNYVLGICGCFIVGFLISWGIVEAWVLFWDYGWIYNELTVPPMILWDIFLTNIITIVIIGAIIAIIAMILLCLYMGG